MQENHVVPPGPLFGYNCESDTSHALSASRKPLLLFLVFQKVPTIIKHQKFQMQIQQIIKLGYLPI